MEKTLHDYVKDNSKFLRLDNGESFEGTYVGFKVTGSRFDPGKETVVYKVKYDDGKEVFFQTASIAVAKLFSKFRGGEKIRITRTGSGTNTKYKISSPDIQISEDELQPDDDLPEDLR